MNTDTMTCPHCNTKIFTPSKSRFLVPHEKDTRMVNPKTFEVSACICPQCMEIIVFLKDGNYSKMNGGADYYSHIDYEKMIYPKKKSNFILSDVIPQQYRDDFREASEIVGISPKASAALCRRILQNLLNNHYNIKKRNLSDEIEEFINSKGIPSYIVETIDAIRNIGNFAAHPLKSTNSGEIIDVEFGEAEWLLEILYSLFDFTYVQPTRVSKTKNELNEKLKDIGKPVMK